MNPTTEQVHGNLKGLLLNGRILLNGLPLSANEIGALLEGEQMLFEKAMQFDKTTELAAKQQTAEKENTQKLSENPPQKKD